MEKDRLGSFIDAVLAIIMTLLALELPKPVSLDLAGLWGLRAYFFAYALSFFSLGTMWVGIHQSYHSVEKISQKTVWSAIIMLFFSSFYPYVTALVAAAFWNKTMQGLYGTVVLLITFSRMLYFRNLDIGAPKDDKSMPPRLQKWMWTELLLKAAGLILSITVFPPAASIAVLFALLVLVIPNQLRNTTII